MSFKLIVRGHIKPGFFQPQTFQHRIFQPQGLKSPVWEIWGWKVHGWKVWGWKVRSWKNHGWKVRDWKVWGWSLGLKSLGFKCPLTEFYLSQSFTGYLSKPSVLFSYRWKIEASNLIINVAKSQMVFAFLSHPTLCCWYVLCGWFFRSFREYGTKIKIAF